MEGLSTKTSYIGTYLKPSSQGSYETGKSCAWKTSHVISHVGAKGGGNKCRIYISTHAPRADRNKITGIERLKPIIIMCL